MLRLFAVGVEVGFLALVMFTLLAGVRLVALDLGIAPKYSRIINLALMVIGAIALFFFVSHLGLLYPG